MFGATQRKIVNRPVKAVALLTLLCFIIVSSFSGIIHDSHDEYEHDAAGCLACALIRLFKQIGVADGVATSALFCLAFAATVSLSVTHLLSDFLTPVRLKVRINR